MKKTLLNFSSILLVILTGGYINYCIAHYIKKWENPFLGFIIAILIYAFWFIFHIIIHESSRLLIGLLIGYKFVSFRIGPFALTKNNNKIELKLCRHNDTFGQCIMCPSNTSPSKISCIFYNLCGGLINVVLGIIGIVLSIIQPYTTLVFILYQSMGTVGLLQSLIRILPSESTHESNDIAIFQNKESA